MILPDFSQAKVLIVGDLMLDRYWSGGTGRISPEAPVPVVNVSGSEDRPGGAANVAVNVATLGAKVTLLGMCGHDENARILKEKLSSFDINCEFFEVPERDTITKLRVMSRNQQLLRLDFEKSFADVDKSALLTTFNQALDDVDIVILSDYAKGCLSDPQSLIRAAKQKGKKVIVDPKGSDFEKYANATLITPNVSELYAVVGEQDNEQSLVASAQSLKASLSLDGLLLTRSEDGMTLFETGEDEFHLPAKAKEVYDVTGAGDTVVSTLAVALASRLPMQAACVLANLAASVVVGKLGTSTVTNTELALAVGEQSVHLDGGVMSEEQLAIAMRASKSRGERIVMTNGCFDILHSGHVSYLEEAAQLGDRLIVAVNTDRSVTELKGPGRPVNNVNRRMAVLAGLSAVDWVVPFEEDTPQRLIARLLPDILVKGGDYKIEDIAGGKEVIENGGEVKVLTFEDGVSTTGIIERITKNKLS
ncbi:MAG TPA: bifunctional heptose 7-phosphate kinase/heptose 1-phosphate adenyltransferase [Alteromonas australica]|uniref:Bifunctional protein HldE n=1 Tax=Alteromonas australica TaxID=589873 RepID=A0A350P884_9ALTE|nr:bifunctional D-glycero-beta-D-manno-heptose-7-phosphate kinase/D-glycero-beta-D-manno-heptose 1-phosphate adenylyltransferase HldE [Alteromonas australica]MAF70298.1 bifunctional heptose 7-phosphate kinase/heptose 1-phosphate adenyltransferase [Alteromonas sp.]HAI71827.1 bifunctional heptose 7-phosphate kinase/heptose 1-phosphate adenyltransferase [Alteromonas australica]HAW77501.1 bifunctional heptose 7-phosphate kinase/heptose 1-phosphate adenyltransferase [Alteromonas australica]HBU51032.|tara:strand:- start:997 stop:2427 length:1431 start_codon:yes stop_codon:yes gene_type:complete